MDDYEGHSQDDLVPNVKNWQDWIENTAYRWALLGADQWRSRVDSGRQLDFAHGGGEVLC